MGEIERPNAKGRLLDEKMRELEAKKCVLEKKIRELERKVEPLSPWLLLVLLLNLMYVNPSNIICISFLQHAQMLKIIWLRTQKLAMPQQIMENVLADLALFSPYFEKSPDQTTSLLENFRTLYHITADEAEAMCQGSAKAGEVLNLRATIRTCRQNIEFRSNLAAIENRFARLSEECLDIYAGIGKGTKISHHLNRAHYSILIRV
jgi:hypothetical protein